MPKAKKPYALKALENKKDVICKAKQAGEDTNAEIQRKGMSLLDADISLRDWGRMRKSAEFQEAIITEFAAMAFLYQPDFAIVGMVGDCLERYHDLMDQFREMGKDDELRLPLANAINREAKTFISLSSKIGLDPASRDKFMLNHSLRKALDKEEKFEW